MILDKAIKLTSCTTTMQYVYISSKFGMLIPWFIQKSITLQIKFSQPLFDLNCSRIVFVECIRQISFTMSCAFFQLSKSFAIKTSKELLFFMFFVGNKAIMTISTPTPLLSEYSNQEGNSLNQWCWKWRWCPFDPDGLWFWSFCCIGPKIKYARRTSSCWLLGYSQICGCFIGSRSKNSMPPNTIASSCAWFWKSDSIKWAPTTKVYCSVSTLFLLKNDWMDFGAITVK
jgi:hypothetical protein